MNVLSMFDLKGEKAIEAGVDIIDTALAPFALRSSHPAVEPMVVALQGTPRDTGLDLAHLFKFGQYIESIAPKYGDFLNTTRMLVIDTGVLMHQTPVTCRPADLFEPELDNTRDAIKDFTQDIGDVLINALYPITGLRFLKWKYGLETPPPEVKPKTMEDVKREDELIAKAKAGKLVEK